MVKEYFLGLTVDAMKENTKMIKNMDSVYTHGQMVVNMLASGKTVSSMAKVFTKI
jgi:hypothetical protein